MQLPLKGGKNSRRADNNGSGFCFGFFTGRGRSWLPGFGQSKAHHDCEDEIEAASVCKLPAPPLRLLDRHTEKYFHILLRNEYLKIFRKIRRPFVLKISY